MTDMTDSIPRTLSWCVAPEDVRSADAVALLRDYFTDVSDRYYELHEKRRSTPVEIEEGLAGSPSDDLAAPTGLFLIGRYSG